MTLREQIEALFAAHRPYGGAVDADDIRAAVLDIIDQHMKEDAEREEDEFLSRCLHGDNPIPDRDALKRALKAANDTDPWTGGTIDGWFNIYTDRVLAALEKQSEPEPKEVSQAGMVKLTRELLEKALGTEMEDLNHGNDD